MSIEALRTACQGGNLAEATRLLEDGADPNGKSGGGWTPLLIACRDGHVHVAELLLFKGADVNSKNKYGRTPLHAACQYGHVHVADLLLSKGADRECMDNEGKPPKLPSCSILDAYKAGHVHIVDWLLSKGAIIDEKDEEGDSLFDRACRDDKLDTASLLLSKGADVNTRNKKGDSPLLKACRAKNVPLVGFLLSYGANANDKDNEGTLLHMAVKDNQLEIVELLLSKGADVNSKNKNGWTTLLIACLYGHVHVAEFLLSKGADVNIKNNDGWTPLYWACQNGRDHIAELLLSKGADRECKGIDRFILRVACALGHVHLAEILLSKGADVNEKDEEGDFLFDRVCRDGKFEMASLLLSKGADVNTRNKKGYSPLLKACRAKDVRLVEFLLSHGANANDKDKKESVLHMAVKDNQLELVELLSSKGAIIDEKDEEGDSLFDRVCRDGNLDMAALLLSKGANVNTQNEKGDSPLRKACRAKDVPLVGFLLSHGANANDKDKEGSLLHMAVKDNQLELLKLLLSKGADVHFKNSFGNTPLCDACLAANVQVASLLLSKGADVNTRNEKGDSPLLKACRAKDVHLVEFLLSHGANANDKDKEGSVLHMAVKDNQLELVELLLSKGADVHFKNSFGNTPLYDACLAANVQISALLLSKGADPLTKGGVNRAARKSTLLENACRFQRPEIAELLLKRIYAHCSSKDFTNAQKLVLAMAQTVDNEPLRNLASLLSYDRILSSMHIHLCGHGCSGKSTVKLSLTHTLSHQSYLGFTFSMSVPSDVGYIPVGEEGRTVGMESSSFEYDPSIFTASKACRYILHDYGGQEQFHINHGGFLSSPGSLYVVMVALWDFDRDTDRGELMTDEKILERYRYWLKFIRSISSEHKDINVVTIVNFKAKADAVERGKSARVQAKLVEEQTRWTSSSSAAAAAAAAVAGGGEETKRLVFCGLPVVLDVRKTSQVHINVNKLILDTMASMGSNSAPVPTCVNEVLATKNVWPRIISKQDFEQRFIVPKLVELFSSSSASSATIAYLKDEVLWQRLVALGEIVVVNEWVVTDCNWLTSTVLGRIVKHVQTPGPTRLLKYLLSSEEIDKYSEHSSAYFGNDKEVLPRLLESVGACIRVNKEQGGVQQWFPAYQGNTQKLSFADLDANLSAFCFLANSQYSSRRIMRRFALVEPDRSMFAPGYFGQLLVEIARLEPNSNKIMMYENGIELEKDYEENGLPSIIKIIVLTEPNQESFVLAVASRTTRTHSSSGAGGAGPPATELGPSYVWRRFESICMLIRKEQRIETRENGSLWLHNLPLNEFCIDPRDIKAASALPMYEVQTRIGDQDEACYAHYFGVNGDGFFVNEKSSEKYTKPTIIKSSDVFISYRVDPDKQLSQRFFDALSDELVVWRDQQCIKDGEDWKEAFVQGLMESNNVAPIVSKGAWANFANASRLAQDRQCVPRVPPRLGA